ncbi:MAG: phage protein GemA/Gp16 family protein [Campylobacteraceae bacterium]
MTNKQKYLRRGLLATIHQHEFTKNAKDNDAWETFLQKNYRIDSSAKLSIDELYNLLDVLNKGSTPKITGIRPKQKTDAITIKQEMYIKELWGDKSLKSLSNFCFRTIKKRPIRLNVLNKNEATKLILGLENMLGVKTK